MIDELETLVGVLGHPGFQVGLFAGSVGAGFLFVVTLVLRRPVPGWGLVFAGAAGVGLMAERSFEPRLVASLALLTAAGILVDFAFVSARSRIGDISKGVVWLVAIVGIVWFTLVHDIANPSWGYIAFPLTILGLGVGVWWLGRLPVAGLVGPLLATSIAGSWVTIPETDDFTVMLGVALPMALVTPRPIRSRAWAMGALTLAGLFASLVLDGGGPRPWTMAASWATIAPLPVIAVVASLRASPPRGWVIFLTHVVYVAAVTRVADHTESALVVSVGSLVLISAAASVLWFMPRTEPVDHPVS